jgi:peroxiredoxin
VVVARLILAATFALAGASKLRSRRRTEETQVAFGVPRHFAPALSIAIPIAELALAVGLVFNTSATFSAVGAIVLLGAFSAAMAANLLMGRRPECNCFGELSAAPIGWGSVARNGGLGGLAVVIVSGAASELALPDIAAIVTASPWVVTAFVLAASIIATEAIAIRLLLEQNGRVLLRIEQLERHSEPVGLSSAAGLPVGSRAPTFALDGVHGETTTLGSLLAIGKPLVLVFGDPGCGPCNALLPDIGRWQRELLAVTIALITRGDRDANRSKATEHGLVNVLLQHDREVADAYVARGTPTAVLVSVDGTVGTGVAAGATAIRQLVERASGQAHVPAGAAETATVAS